MVATHPHIPAVEASGAVTTSGGEAPRPVTRGAECQSQQGWGIGVHWLRASFPPESFGRLVDLAIEFAGDVVDVRPGRFFRRQSLKFAAEGSVTLHFDPADDGAVLSADAPQFACGASRPVLEVPGGFLETLEPRDVMRLCQEVAALGGRPTRLDVAADDYRKRVLPSQVNAVAKSGDIARFRTQTCAFHEGGYFEGAIGETFTAGRRGADGSGAYLRYYRKDVESRGRINAFRWEVEFSDEKAQLAFTELLKAQTLDEFTLAGAYLVIGSVDFPMRNGGDEAHLERLERHAFWVDITSDFFNCTLLKVKRATSTLERKAAHVRERCGSLLKAVMAMFQMTRPSDRAGRRAFYAALGQWVDLAKPSAASREAVAAYAFVNKLSPPAWVNLAPRVT